MILCYMFGVYFILVVMLGKGFVEIFEEYSKFKYVLIVYFIFFLIGLVVGGICVVIIGEGFGFNVLCVVVMV